MRRLVWKSVLDCALWKKSAGNRQKRCKQMTFNEQELDKNDLKRSERQRISSSGKLVCLAFALEIIRYLSVTELWFGKKVLFCHVRDFMWI